MEKPNFQKGQEGKNGSFERIINQYYLFLLINKKTDDLVKDGKLTKKGKEFAKIFFEELIKILGINLEQSTEQELKYINEKSKEVFEKFREITKGDQESIKFISLLEKSFRFRLERFRQLKYFDEIQNSQSPFLELMAALKEYYSDLPEKFVENFSLSFFLKIKKFIEKLADDLVEKQKIEDLSFLISLLERKFVDLAITKIKAQEELSKKAKIKSLLDLEKIKSEIDLENIEEFLKSQEVLYKEVQEEIADIKIPESEELIGQITAKDIPDINENQPERISTRIIKRLVSVGTAIKTRISETQRKLRKKSLPIILSTIMGVSLIGNSGILAYSIKSSTPEIQLPSSIERTIRNIDSFEIMEKILKEEFTKKDLSIPAQELIRLDKNSEGLLQLSPGRKFYIEDLLRKIKQISNFALQNSEKIDRQILAKNIRFLLAPCVLYPEAISFELIEKENGDYLWQPLDYLPNIEVKESIKGDIVLIGNELETILGCITAAKKNQKVILVYDGDLGGLSATNGGNMRFFDFVENATVTPEMEEIFNELGMQGDKKWVIPQDVSQRLDQLLAKYNNNITLIKTRTLNSLNVKKDNNQISKIITEEGIEINANLFIDSTPDGIISCKAGIPFTIENLNISYGVVFDVNNLEKDDIERLGQISKEDLLDVLNLTEEEIKQDPELSPLYDKFLKALNKSQVKKVGFHTRYGYQPLGIMIDMYLKLKSREDNIDKIVPEINKRRISEGFNVAVEEDGNGRYIATLNSISYNSEKSYHQGDHNLQTDDDPLIQVVRYDLGRIEELLKKLLNKNDITVRIPKEFYVRQATKVFYTPNTLTYEKFKQSEGEKKFSYGYDARGLQNRFTIPADNSKDLYRSFYKVIKEDYEENNGRLSWNINALHTKTNIENLFIVNKGGGVEPALVPTYRIIQNLMLVMSELIENIDNEDYFKKNQIVTEDPRLKEARQKYYGDYYRHFEELEVRISLAPQNQNISNNLPTINFQDGKLIINYPFYSLI